jgi:hypothetical protein
MTRNSNDEKENYVKMVVGVLRYCPIEVSSCKLASQPGVERPQ